MLETIQSILRDNCKLEMGKPILAGVSGGPDSLCLLSLLHEAGYEVIAAHFNHKLRPEAEGDAAAVEKIAGGLGVRFVGGGGNVRQFAADEKLSIETAAREMRYRFLFDQARQVRAQAVAVGHTADDQVETVLMHFLRGAGLNGLKGMPYRTVLPNYDAVMPLVRPLLDFWRPQTVGYCEAQALAAHYDASNESLDYLRNRLRHELIPLLETYNPRFREAAWRSGKTLSADYELLVELFEPVWKRVIVGQADEYLAFDLPALLEQPAALRMHILRRAVQGLVRGHDTGYADLQRGVDFLANSAQDRTDFTGGLTLLREEGLLYVTTSEARLPLDQWPQMPAGSDSMAFTAPGALELASGWRLTSSRSVSSDLAEQHSWEDADRFQVLLDAKELPAELTLRARRAGDRFEPLGMEGHSQKLSDFFVNAKLPVRARERWPLLCAGDEVIWVPGYRPAHRHRLRPDSTEMLCATISPPQR